MGTMGGGVGGGKSLTSAKDQAVMLSEGRDSLNIYEKAIK